MCKLAQKIMLMFLIFVISSVTHADDIEAINKASSDDAKLLFILDLSGSMRMWLKNDRSTSRIDVLRSSFQDIVNDPELADLGVGIGVATFSGIFQDPSGWNGSAHGIAYPISPLRGVSAQSILSTDSFTHQGNSYMPPAGLKDTRKYLTELSSSKLWNPNGGTPIVDALYEGALYFRGDKVDFGRQLPDHSTAAHPSTYIGSLTQGSCTTVRETLTRSDSTGGRACVTNSVTELMCDENETSCALGTGCVEKSIAPATRSCDITFTDIGQCIAANPTYHSCKVEPIVDCSTTANGSIKCENSSTQIICKEDQTRYFCDQTPDISYTCNFPVQRCVAKGDVTYKSPITSECSANAIILLSDGQPTTLVRSKDKIQAMIGATCAKNDFASAGQCGPELAGFLHNTDQNQKIKGNQNVAIHTIGLAVEAKSKTAHYLYDLARHGGGSFSTANTKEQLVAAFKRIALDVGGKSIQSFSAPAYSVNTETMLSHGKYVYVPIFETDSGPYWRGNLKKYEIIDGDLYGKNGKEATEASGAINNNVADLWSGSNKSSDAVNNGGFSHKIKAKNRNALTDIGGKLVSIDNATNTQLGVASNADKLKLIRFIKGIDDTGKPRHYMGDIIHSKPVQLMQKNGSSVIFVGTNEGYLHAINADTGKELFAYMPQELLKNIKDQYAKTMLGSHLYGVDGPITLVDEDNNNIQESGESATIYFGLRRGGKAYYALDVTAPSSPKLKWKFRDPLLGYTWSQPTVAKLKYDGPIAKNVLIFGGGYIDDNHLDTTTPDTDKNPDHVGAVVYIINADDGTLIKRITSSELEYAVPSKIKALDIDRDGSVDRLYFSDTGGNLLRVDLDPDRDNNIADANLTKLASLGGTEENNRKFFNAPDVAIFKRGGQVILTVSIGSGDRTNPLNDTVHNKFFMVMDENVFKEKGISSQNTTINDLYSAGDNFNLVNEIGKSSGKRGWMKALDRSGVTGEKSLSSSITFQNKVLFSTFALGSATTTTSTSTSTSTSTTSNIAGCGSSSNNKTAFYALDLLTGKAAYDLNGNGSFSQDDSYKEMSSGDIPETPQVIRGDFKSKTGGPCTKSSCVRDYNVRGNDGKNLVGSGTAEANPVNSLPRVYWLERDR